MDEERAEGWVSIDVIKRYLLSMNFKTGLYIAIFLFTGAEVGHIHIRSHSHSLSLSYIYIQHPK